LIESLTLINNSDEQHMMATIYKDLSNSQYAKGPIIVYFN